MSSEAAGQLLADMLSLKGELPDELERRAKGYRYPFRAILEVAAERIRKAEAREQYQNL